MARLSTWIATIALAQFTCADAAAPSTASPPTAAPADSLTIQQLMDARVDPSADVLWDSVAFIATLKGEEDRRPRTPAEWDAVRRSALALIDAVNELSMPGRRVSSIDKQPGPGELRTSEIQRLIDADPGAFARRAGVLGSAAKEALAAIDARDADALMKAGGVIDEACETCHLTYWYPHRQ
jgi:cytochrome c556